LQLPGLGFQAQGQAFFLGDVTIFRGTGALDDLFGNGRRQFGKIAEQWRDLIG
jgi:hypothetical protein